MNRTTQPWLANPLLEGVFILAPAIVPVAIVFAFNDYFRAHEVSTLWWIVLVLCIDVSHVYSTLFRLYWDKQTFIKYKRHLIIIPVAGFMAGFALHYYDALFFWRVLAYVAVYHFVRQQYGFMRLYARKESGSQPNRFIDAVAIYNATLYPLIHWHIHSTEKITWFVKGDFMRIELSDYTTFFRYLYLLIILIYVIKEGKQIIRNRHFNIPKNLIMVGTYLSWYVGIVTFQGDLIFTLLNVVAHGIPYMALIWIYGEKKAGEAFSFNWKGAGIFAGALLLLAYLEENLWDSLVWKDHVAIFPILSDLSPVENPVVLSLVVSILVLPQVTHYVLDGFIWRFSKDSKARL